MNKQATVNPKQVMNSRLIKSMVVNPPVDHIVETVQSFDILSKFQEYDIVPYRSKVETIAKDLEIIRLIANGRIVDEIQKILHISDHNYSTSCFMIRKAFDCNKMTQLIYKLFNMGFFVKHDKRYLSEFQIKKDRDSLEALLEMLASGFTLDDIGKELEISPTKINNMKRILRMAFNAKTHDQAFSIAMMYGIID